MDKIEHILIFKTVVESGQFSHAAKILGYSNASITQKINQLEHALGVQLIHRTTRRFSLTDAGETLYQHALAIANQLTLAENAIAHQREELQGILKVTAPTHFGHQYLTPIVVAFMREHPKIQVHLQLMNQTIDLIQSQCDLAIRGKGYFEADDWDYTQLKSRLLLRQTLILVASPEYCQTHGVPRTIDDLLHHQCILLTSDLHLTTSQRWCVLEDSHKRWLNVKGDIHVNTVDALIAAARSHAGIIMVPELSVNDALTQKSLIRILPDFLLPTYTLTALYPQTAYLPPRVRHFIDYLVKYFDAFNKN